MSAYDEVRIPFRFEVRAARPLAPGETPPEPVHSEALGPNHHHLPMRIELQPSPELDALLAAPAAIETTPSTGIGSGWGPAGRRRRAMSASGASMPAGPVAPVIQTNAAATVGAT